MIDSSFLDYTVDERILNKGFEIDSECIKYQPKPDPVQEILKNNDYNNYEKIEKIQTLMKDKYDMYDADFTYFIASELVCDKKIMKALMKELKKKLKKQQKKINKYK